MPAWARWKAETGMSRTRAMVQGEEARRRAREACGGGPPRGAAAALLALQRGAGNRAATRLVARQAVPGGAGGTAAPPDPVPPAPRPLPPRLKVTITAHASPRWRSARDARTADERNLALSRKRAETVRREVERRLTAALPPDARVDFNVDVLVAPDAAQGSIDVDAEGRGSTDTLAEAGGDRRSDDATLRRVDVVVEQVDREERYAGVGLPPTVGTETLKTTRWWVNVLNVSQAGLGYTVALIKLRIRNSDTGRTGEATVLAPLGGGSVGVSTSSPVSGDEVSFWTDEPMGFADFEGVWVRLSSIGAGLIFIGWEKSLLSFVGLGPLAQELDVGGWNFGAQLKLGGSVLSGTLSWDGGPPSDDYPVPGPTHDWVPFEHATTEGDALRLGFGTGESDLDDVEAERLQVFADRIGSRFAGRLLPP